MQIQMQIQHKPMQMHIQRTACPLMFWADEYSGQMQMQMQIHRTAYPCNVTICQADEKKVMNAWAKIAGILLSLDKPC